MFLWPVSLRLGFARTLSAPGDDRGDCACAQSHAVLLTRFHPARSDGPNAVIEGQGARKLVNSLYGEARELTEEMTRPTGEAI